MTLHRNTIPLITDETNGERQKIVAAMRRILIAEKPTIVASGDRLVIDALRREAAVTRSALTHRHTDLKDLFLHCVEEREQQGRVLRTPNEIALEERIDELTNRNRELQTRANHWEGAARDLARTVAALQTLYATASARLDALISDRALERLEADPGSTVAPFGSRRRT